MAVGESGGEYERIREERMRENMERMKKLGIMDLSQKLLMTGSTARAKGRGRRRQVAVSESDGGAAPVKTLPPPLPPRRSTRLQNTAPVTYAENDDKKGEKPKKRSLVSVGEREEVYTEEHLKLLGSCELTWTLFVDGYDKHGKRIYDPVSGKTCHQCRQKTLGLHTHCSQCNIVQGQFCGDCLFMRYGENVLEVHGNPSWICPVCRGICNCSLCRTKKGWAPTGSLYRKVISLGFKSVAHYLIETHMYKPVSADTVSAQAESPTKELIVSDKENITFPEEAMVSAVVSNPESFDNNINLAIEISLDDADKSSNVDLEATVLNVVGSCKNMNNCSSEITKSSCESEPAENSPVAAKPCNKRKSKSPAVVSPDSIARRLRSQTDKALNALSIVKSPTISDKEDKSCLPGALGSDTVLNPEPSDKNIRLAKPCAKEKKRDPAVVSPNSIARRLRSQTGKALDALNVESCEDGRSGNPEVAVKSGDDIDKILTHISSAADSSGRVIICCSKESIAAHANSSTIDVKYFPKRKKAKYAAANPDCIAGRLRRRSKA